VTNEGHVETTEQLKQHSCTPRVKSLKWQMIFFVKRIQYTAKTSTKTSTSNQGLYFITTGA
jgi:hypothetical protein